jgi:hypothetical protein
MTFDGQMRIGSLEIAAALLVVAIAAARPRVRLGQEVGSFTPVRIGLQIAGFGGSERYEGPCPLVIGRTHEADVVLGDPEVSRRHARLECENGIVYVRDLESSNGTFLNGRRVNEAIEVRRGDEIDVGTTRLTVEELR